MGAKTWMLVFSQGHPGKILKSKPVLDRAATLALAKRMFAAEKITYLSDGDLCYTCPADDELVFGCFPGLTIVAASEFASDLPSSLSKKFLDVLPGHSVYLHAMHSVVDWFAYAVWENGRLRRALSLSPDSGVLEDIGLKLPFEEAFWDGEYAAVDLEKDGDYPFPFHPLELAEAALHALFGYQLEGAVDDGDVAPEQICLMRFSRKKSWWRRASIG